MPAAAEENPRHQCVNAERAAIFILRLVGEFLLLSVALKAIELADPPLSVYGVIGPAVIVWIVWAVARAVRRLRALTER